MKDKKHIDRLFQEKFKDFEVSPNNSVWKNIEKELKSKKRKSLVIPWWYKISGAAAVLALLLLAGNFLFTNFDEIPVVKSEPSNEVSPSEKILQKEIRSKQSIVSEGNSESNSTGNLESRENNPVRIGSQKQTPSGEETQKILGKTFKSNKTSETADLKSVAKTSETVGSKSEIKIAANEISEEHNSSKTITKIHKNTQKTLASNETSIATSKNSVMNPEEKTKTQNDLNLGKIILDTTSNQEVKLAETTPSAENKKKKSLLEIANQQKEEEIFDKENQVVSTNTDWQISPFAAPIYYGSFGSQNAIDPSLAQNESKSEITMSYGVNFSYKVSERIKIRSGVGQVSMAYNTYDIAFATSVKSSVFSNISYSSPSTDNLNIVPLKSIQNTNNGELLGRSPYTPGTLHQQIGFIEVPLEIEYALIDKKFGLSFIGGASTLFLNNNSLVINSENGRTNLGKMQNLNNVSFSTNIGFGFDYKISKQFEFNLEPTFKYQINSFSGNNNGFQPYYFGIYTGIGFKF